MKVVQKWLILDKELVDYQLYTEEHGDFIFWKVTLLFSVLNAHWCSCPYLSSEILLTCFCIVVGVSHSKELQIKWKTSKIWSCTLFLDHLLTQRNIIDTCSVGYSCSLQGNYAYISLLEKCQVFSTLLEMNRAMSYPSEIQVFGFLWSSIYHCVQK